MKRETKVRLSLFAGSTAIILIVAVFLWLINSDQNGGDFLRYMVILDSLALLSLAVFFAFGQIFDQNGNVYTSRIITMLVCILMLTQLSSSFLSYTTQSVDFSFSTFDHAFEVVQVLDDSGEEGADEVLKAQTTKEFTYFAIADENGDIISSSDYELSGRRRQDDGALFFVLYSGNTLLAKTSDSYASSITTELIISQATLLIISLLFSVEFVMFIVGKVSKIGQATKSTVPAIFTGVRQTAFLFYFASRLSATFIPIMAKEFPTVGLGLSPNMLAALPQTVETLFTCIAIVFSNSFITKKGWKPPFMFGLVWVMLGTFACGLAPNLLVFILARALVGLGYGFSWMTLRTVALFGKDDEAQMWGFSMLSAGIYAGMFCGSTVGSIIAVKYGYKAVLMVSGIILGVCGINNLTMANQKLAQEERAVSQRKKIRGRDLWTPLMFLLLMIAPSSIVVAYSGYYLPLFYQQIGRGVLDVGRVQLLYGLIIVYFAPSIAQYLVRHSHRPLLINMMYNIILALGLVVLGIFGNFGASVIAMVIIAVGDGFGFGAQNTYYLAMPINNALGGSRALMILSLLKKLMEMLGPTIFAFALGGLGNGVLILGIIFACLALVYLLFTKFFNKRVERSGN